MAYRQQCKCGHSKGDHSSCYVGKEGNAKLEYRHCRVETCKCRKYIFDKAIYIRRGAAVKNHLVSKERRANTIIYTMKNCNDKRIPFNL